MEGQLLLFVNFDLLALIVPCLAAPEIDVAESVEALAGFIVDCELNGVPQGEGECLFKPAVVEQGGRVWTEQPRIVPVGDC